MQVSLVLLEEREAIASFHVLGVPANRTGTADWGECYTDTRPPSKWITLGQSETPGSPSNLQQAE